MKNPISYPSVSRAYPVVREPRLCARQRGFGLVEAMITIGISLILLSIAAPDLGALVRKNRVKTAAEDFVSTIVLARTEAIKRGAPVSPASSRPLEG